MKLKTLLSGCTIALPLFASTAIFSSSANAYPLAKVTNNTRFTATGRVEYLGGGGIFGCNPDSYSVAPGKTWTAQSRGACLIDKITANLSGGPSVVSYTSTGTSYSNFAIQPTGSGYRVFSEQEYSKYTDNRQGKSPGFLIKNKTDWPLAISLNQVGCLYHDVVGKGDVFKRDTGAVWFTIGVNIQPDGQTKSDWDCVKPVAEIVGTVLFAAATGGYGAFVAGGSRIAVATAAATATVADLAQFTAEEIGKLIVDNGELELKGQYAGYAWPFRCDKMPEYHITGGPSLKVVDGKTVIGPGTKLTMTKVNDCGDNMMTGSRKSVSTEPQRQWALPDELNSSGPSPITPGEKPKPKPITQFEIGEAISQGKCTIASQIADGEKHTLSMVLDGFFAENSQRKRCLLRVNTSIPSGFRIKGVRVLYQGETRIPDGANASFC